MGKLVYDGNALDRYGGTSYKFLEVESCGVHVDSNYITKRSAGRRDYHLLYVKDGEMICLFDGKYEKIRRGGYVLYPPKVPQEYEQNGGVCYWVHFSGTAALEIVADSGLRSKPLSFSGMDNDAIVSVFERMIYRYVTGSCSDGFALSADLLTLLSSLKIGAVENRSVNSDDRLCAVVSYIHKHYADDTPLEEYARMTYVSTDRFMHLFKEIMGISPYAYVMKIRIERAADFLALSDKTVAEIANKVGFKDSLYFSKAFKKRMGMSPIEFRRKKGTKTPRRIKSSGCD